MTAKKKITLETLAAQIAKGFARHDKRFDKIESFLSKHDEKLIAILEQTVALTEDMTYVKSLVTVTSDDVLRWRGDDLGCGRSAARARSSSGPTLGSRATRS